MAENSGDQKITESLVPLMMLLGIDKCEQDLKDKLSWIINATKARLKILLGGIDPPVGMDHIVIEVSVIRFNRIGSEGIKSQTVEGESNSYTDGDFDGFMDEIQAFLDSQKDATRGRLRFL